jgi:hypothetical protein
MRTFVIGRPVRLESIFSGYDCGSIASILFGLSEIAAPALPACAAMQAIYCGHFNLHL